MPLYGAGLADVEAVSIDKSLYHGEELGIEHQAHIAALAVAMIVIADHLCTVGLEEEGRFQFQDGNGLQVRRRGRFQFQEWEWVTIVCQARPPLTLQKSERGSSRCY